MKTWTRYMAMSVVALLVLSACDDGVVDSTNDDDDGVPETALVSVYLTDAPGDVAAAWVDVVEIYLQGGPEGRVVLLDEATGLIELTSLAGTATPLVQDAEVEAATYGQLRFVIGGAVLEAADGSVYAKDGAEHPEGLPTTGELHCPSCSQTGIKVIMQGTDLDLEGGSEDFLLDFDVTQSFGREAGQSGRWVMNPVIHGLEMIELGRITGTVALATDEEEQPTVSIPECPEGTPRDLSYFVPTATTMSLTDDEGSPILRTGMTDADGQFRILALAPDEYELGYIEEMEFEGESLVWTADVDPLDIEVTASGEAAGVAFTITSAACVPDENTEG